MRTPETTAGASWSVSHATSPADRAVVAAARAMVEPMKGLMRGTAARQPFDEIMGHVVAPGDVAYEEDTIGGVPGWWCRPSNKKPVGTILYFHGGWYAWGSARIYRHFAGHIAARSGAAVFVADYRLAPEHPFPAGLTDALACYRGLVEQQYVPANEVSRATAPRLHQRARNKRHRPRRAIKDRMKRPNRLATPAGTPRKPGGELEAASGDQSDKPPQSAERAGSRSGR